MKKKLLQTCRKAVPASLQRPLNGFLAFLHGLILNDSLDQLSLVQIGIDYTCLCVRVDLQMRWCIFWIEHETQKVTKIVKLYKKVNYEESTINGFVSLAFIDKYGFGRQGLGSVASLRVMSVCWSIG